MAFSQDKSVHVTPTGARRANDNPRSRPAKRRSHLIDPNAPRPKYDPDAEKKLTHVQQWVLSTLAVTTILHLVAGFIIAAITLDNPAPGARVGLNVIAGHLRCHRGCRGARNPPQVPTVVVAAGRARSGHHRSLADPALTSRPRHEPGIKA